MRLFVGFLCAMLISSAQAADRDLKNWAMESRGRSCKIHTFAYSAGNQNRMLFIQWSPDKGYEMSAWGEVKEDELVIEAVGTTDSFTVAPVDTNHLLAGAAVETVVANLAAGHEVKLTSKHGDRGSWDYSVAAENPQQASAALAACVEKLKKDPVPADADNYRGTSGFLGSPQECVMDRFWRTAEAAFQITLEATPQGSAVIFERVLSMHGAAPTEAFTVDARQFFGGTSSDMRTVRVDLTEAQLARLEGDLLAGKVRNFDLSLPKFGTETLSFGSPLSRAPAAMFTACRKALAAERPVSN